MLRRKYACTVSLHSRRRVRAPHVFVPPKSGYGMRPCRHIQNITQLEARSVSSLCVQVCALLVWHTFVRARISSANGIKQDDKRRERGCVNATTPLRRWLKIEINVFQGRLEHWTCTLTVLVWLEARHLIKVFEFRPTN